MTESPTRTSKSDIMHSMMRNKENSKLIREALSSPVGSTSRAKAQKMFSIMGKLSNANDGAGGPGFEYQRIQSEPIQHNPQENSKSMVIFHKIPSPKITYGKKITPVPQAAKYDGFGGPGIHDGAGGFFSDAYSTFNNAIQSISNYVEPLPGPNFMAPLATVTQGIQNTISPSTKATTSNVIPAGTSPGLITQAKNFISNSVIPTVVKGTGVGLAGLAGVGQVAGSTIKSLYNTIDQTLNGKTSSSPSTAITPFSQTWGGQIANNIVNSPSPSLSPVQAYSTLNGINYDNAGNQITDTAVAKANNAAVASSINANKPAATTANNVSSAQGTSNNASTTNQSTQSSSPLGSTNNSSTVLGATNNGTANNSNITYTPGTKPGGSSFSQAISTVESGSPQGNYQAVGKTMGAGSSSAGYAALGKYQIMPNFWFDKIGLNKDSATDKQKFLNSPDLQEQLHQIIVDTLAKQYNNDPAKMAAAYFGGDLGVKNLGTVAGDQQTDGNLSVNQYVNKVLTAMGGIGSYTGTDTTGNTVGSTSGTSNGMTGSTLGGNNISTSGVGDPNSDVAARIQNDIKNHVGAGMSAYNEIMNPNDPISHGKSLAQDLADKDAELRKSTGYDDLKTQKMIAEQEKVNLPKDMATFIRDRETYVATTDKNIADFREKMKTMDLSNPETRDSANRYLNYLYTLRGRQNQTYMGYIQQASDLQQRKVEDITNRLATVTDEYKTKLTNYTAVRTSDYTTWMAALSGMYTEAKNAPTEALQYDYLKKQVLSASTLSPSDALKTGYIKQSDELKGYLTDKNGLAVKGTNLMQKIQTLVGDAQNPGLDPTYKTANIFQAYVDGVNRYLNADNEKDATTGTGVTSAGKKAIAEEAMRNFAQVAINASQAGDDQTMLLAAKHAYNVGNEYSKQMATTVSPYASILKQDIAQLAPKAWITGNPKTPLSEAEFLSLVKKDTQGALDDSIAKAIYATFNRYRIDDGNKTTSGLDAVHAMLYSISNTSNRSNDVAFTDDEFAKNIGNLYSSMVLASEFQQDPQAQAAMQQLLYAK